MFVRNLKIAVAALATLVSCSTKKSDSQNSLTVGRDPDRPHELPVAPNAREQFKATSDAREEAQIQKQIQFLKDHGHDILWFDKTEPAIRSHQTVQIIYFNYNQNVIGFCSGAIVGENKIATAGHCNARWANEVNRDSAPLSCAREVIFAYKPAPNDPVQYFGCDKLVLQVYKNKESWENVSNGDSPNSASIHSVNRWDLEDYALFTLRKTPGTNRQEFLNTAKALQFDQSLFAKAYFSNWNTIAVVVDPPMTQGYVSQMDTVLGEMVDEYSYFQGWTSTPNAFFVKGLGNNSQPGNSGSPVYARLNTNALKLQEFSLETAADWAYLSPLYGVMWLNSNSGRKEAMVYTRPDLFYQKMAPSKN